MKRKVIGILAGMLFSLGCLAQGRTDIKTKTERVGAQYVVDSATFKTCTGYVIKITTLQKQFVQQATSDTASEFLVKKEWTPVSARYYLKSSLVYGKDSLMDISDRMLLEFNYPPKK